MSMVYVALGSNLGDREGHLIQGSRDLEQLPGCFDVVSSSIYETTPLGPQDQPDYLNCVCQLRCELEPQALLTQLQIIERQHGRVQSTERWTARPLDMDILLFGELELRSETLRIPHVGITERSFVLWPLAELKPDLLIPGHGDIGALKKSCPQYGIRKISAGLAE